MDPALPLNYPSFESNLPPEDRLLYDGIRLLASKEVRYAFRTSNSVETLLLTAAIKSPEHWLFRPLSRYFKTLGFSRTP